MKPSNKIDHRNWIEIDLQAFTSNLNELKRFLSQEQSFLQVVKADGYGHGAYQIARVALENGAAMLGVANVEEALYLRYQKIKAPILILSPSITSEIDQLIEYDIIPSISDIEFAKSLDKRAKERNKIIPIHIKINTGMNRNGIKHNEIENFFDNFSLLKNLSIEGLFSHFAASDDDIDFSVEQYNIFQKSISIFQSQKYSNINRNLKYYHIDNSLSLVNDIKAHTSPLFQGNLVRFGIMTYGYYLDESLKNKIKLSPVMSFKSKISHISEAQKGETIGYNRTFSVTKDLKYAIVPVGYADGYDFLLSGKSFVIVISSMDTNIYLCPVLGKISMDMLCIDVSDMPNIKLNDDVILLGNQLEQVSATHLASLYGGSVYELLCQLGRRAKRYYFQGNKLIDDEPLQRRSFIPTDFTTSKLNDIIEQAISQRLNSVEISSVIYEDILKNIFIESDRDISYRSNFNYSIQFIDSINPDFYRVKTVLSYDKVLQNEEFTIVCANDSETLQHYFQQSDCEYRWLLDNMLFVNNNNFSIKLYITDNKSKIYTSHPPRHKWLMKPKSENGINQSLIYRFKAPILKQLCGKEVNFHIETETLYPKDSHQLSVYINEITKGVQVSFVYPKKMGNVDISVVFSGKERFPEIKIIEDTFLFNTIEIKTKQDTWVFPSSAIVFSF